jgi:exonuclease III
MSFRTKYQHLTSADILVVPECESKEKLPKELLINYPNCYWYGKNKNKGIAIFSKSEYLLEIEKNFDPKLEYIIPIKVSAENLTFYLFGIWSQVNGNYTNNLHKALAHYKQQLSHRIILLGDFNSNKIWDKKPSLGNHSKTVELLEDLNIRSAYHEYFDEDQGEESKPTFFMYHHKDKPYHIDYCFVSKDIKIKGFEIGIFEDWKEYSDHMPITINIEL